MPILRNINRNIAIFLFPLDQGIIDALRINFPAPGVERYIRIGIGLKPALHGFAFLGGLPGTIVVAGIVDSRARFTGMIRLHQQPAVGILTEEVNRILGDDRAVLLLHKRQINPGGLYLVDQFLRDFPLDRRIKHPVIGKQIAVFHRFQILRRRLERFSAAGGVD